MIYISKKAGGEQHRKSEFVHGLALQDYDHLFQRLRGKLGRGFANDRELYYIPE